MSPSRTDSLSRADRDAMERAIEMVRGRGAARCEQINDMLRTDGFQSVGTFAASSCQCDSLRLKPWQTAPLWVGDLDAALRQPFGGQRGTREAAELLKKLLDNGLSKYEPDPLAALDEAKAKRAKR